MTPHALTVGPSAMTESWTPRIVVAVLLGGALFWLARETDRLGAPGWWTFGLVAVALVVLLLSHGRAGFIWTGIFVGTALIVLGAAVLVPRHDQYDQLADRLLGHGLLAPVFLGVWLLLLVAMVIVVAGRSHVSHLVIAVALAAATPVLGTAVAGPVHAVQAEIIADHTTADHARVTGTTTDGPAGPLREQWTVRDPNVTGVVVVGDTVITAQAKGIVALDAATGAERWRCLLPDQEYWPGAVVSPSTGVVAFALDGVVVLLDIGSGEQVGLVALPATDEAWTPVAGEVL